MSIPRLTIHQYQGPKLMIPGLVLVLVHGNYCSACHEFMPTFKQFARYLESAGKDSYLRLATIQLDSENALERGLSTRLQELFPFSLQTIPALVLYREGKCVGLVQTDGTLQNLIDQFVPPPPLPSSSSTSRKRRFSDPLGHSTLAARPAVTSSQRAGGTRPSLSSAQPATHKNYLDYA